VIVTSRTFDNKGYGHQFAPIYDALFPAETVTSQDLQWLQTLVGDKDTVRVIELGVGTGRIALPLARRLAQRGTYEYIGVDVSDSMLAALAVADTESLVRPVLADITRPLGLDRADLVLCVCATIGMVTDTARQIEVFRNAASCLRPGGIFAVEVHNPTFLARLHRQERRTFAVPYPGERKALVSFSELKGEIWHLDHCWVDGDTATFASEVSRLTSLDDLDAYAGATGLESVSRTAGLGGAPIREGAATVTAVYRLVADLE
jgi:SAM-dependent methyltransferase